MASTGTGPIERYFQIVEIVAASRDGLTLTDITQLTGLPKPTAHRLVRTLVELGILASDDTWYKTFRVGSRMWRILHLGVERDKASAFAQLVLDDLAARFGETAYVVRLDRTGILSIARSAPDQGHRLHVLPGDHLPAHAAASAKAILAFQDSATLDAHLQEPLERLTPFTHTQKAEVLRDFDNVRRTGYATCDREIDENIMAYACPVVIEQAGIIYAVGVTGPVSRLSKHPAEHWVAPLKSAAARLGTMLATLSAD